MGRVSARTPITVDGTRISFAELPISVPRDPRHDSNVSRSTAILSTLAKLLGLSDTPGNEAVRFESHWRDYLRQHVWQYSHLHQNHRDRIEDVVANMVAKRRWTGGNGFELNDEMRVAIAGQAALMTLGIDKPYYFPHVTDIIIYPKPFFVPHQQSSQWTTDPVFGGSSTPRYGEAWQNGPVILAWSIIANPYDKRGPYMGVVLHEFAHHLDALDGDMTGMPPMGDIEYEREWHRVTELDFLELVGQAERGEPALLDHYGATNRAEFFAVATECFFNHPHDVRERHPHLYRMLATYFRQSPADLIPRSAQPAVRLEKVKKPIACKPRVSRNARVEDPFTRGLLQSQEGELDDALVSFTQAIAADAEDSEAFAQRALVHLARDEFEAAITDANAALELDEEDLDAKFARGSALVLSGRSEEGIADLRLACEKEQSAEAHAYLGFAYIELDRFKQAVHELSIAVQLDPYSADVYRWRAQAYRGLGEEEQALRDDERANRLDPPREEVS